MWGRLSADNMESWDEAKLEEVVDQKHGESNKKMPQTAIVSHIVPFVGFFVTNCFISGKTHMLTNLNLKYNYVKQN